MERAPLISLIVSVDLRCVGDCLSSSRCDSCGEVGERGGVPRRVASLSSLLTELMEPIVPKMLCGVGDIGVVGTPVDTPRRVASLPSLLVELVEPIVPKMLCGVGDIGVVGTPVDTPRRVASLPSLLVELVEPIVPKMLCVSKCGIGDIGVVGTPPPSLSPSVVSPSVLVLASLGGAGGGAIGGADGGLPLKDDWLLDDRRTPFLIGLPMDALPVLISPGIAGAADESVEGVEVRRATSSAYCRSTPSSSSSPGLGGLAVARAMSPVDRDDMAYLLVRLS